MEIVTGPNPAEGTGDAIVVPVARGMKWGPGADWIAATLGPGLKKYLREQRFSGKRGRGITVPGGTGVRYNRRGGEAKQSAGRIRQK